MLILLIEVNANANNADVNAPCTADPLSLVASLFIISLVDLVETVFVARITW